MKPIYAPRYAAYNAPKSNMYNITAPLYMSIVYNCIFCICIVLYVKLLLYGLK